MEEQNKRKRSEEAEGEAPLAPIDETPTIIIDAAELEKADEEHNAVNGDEEQKENIAEDLDEPVLKKRKTEPILTYSDGTIYSTRSVLVLTLKPCEDDEAVERYIFDYDKMRDTFGRFMFSKPERAKDYKLLAPNATRSSGWCNLVSILKAMAIYGKKFLVTTGLTLPDDEDDPEWLHLTDDAIEYGMTPNVIHAYTAFFESKAKELEFPSKEFQETQFNALFKRLQSKWYSCLLVAYTLDDTLDKSPLPVFNYEKLRWTVKKDITVKNQYCGNSVEELNLGGTL